MGAALRRLLISNCGDLYMPAPSQVVVLVHGIRDHALWQNEIRQALSENFIVETTNYGRLDLIRFLFPLSYFRNKSTERVWHQIKDIRKQYQDADISIIAHSFGTHIVANILKREFDFSAFRVIFCGSVVRYDFPFEQVSDRFTTPILNEVGTRDVWPAIAESLTWGYGSAGTYGFRRPRVRDRWHSGAKHGYFLNAAFCKKYWVPFLKDGTIVDGAKRPKPPPMWLKTLYVLRLKYICISFLLSIIGLIIFAPSVRSTLTSTFGTSVCYPFNPATDEPDTSRPPRECRPGRLAYIKWIDESAYDAVDRPTGRWPNDRANRSLSLSHVDEGGTPIWLEQNLLRIDAGKSYWQLPPPDGWTEIVGNSTEIIHGEVGALMRRQSAYESCSSGRVLLETFLPIDLDDRIRQGIEVKMKFRWSYFNCSDKRPLRLQGDAPAGEQFAVGRIVFAVKD
ncbi:hypothetical protein ACU4I5_26975 (plasmid) [Ensifer adhaerens]